MATTQVSSSLIKDASITAAKMAANSVDSAQYVDGSIDTEHIANGQITVGKMAANSVDSDQYVNGSIDTIHIADGQITVGKMAANSVDSDQYVDGSIDTAHIADSQITSAKIADGTIATGDIANDAVTADKVANNIKVAGRETIYVPAAAMYPQTTNGCSDLTQVEMTAGKPELKCLDFAAAADDHAQFTIAFPKSWNEGTVTFQAFFTVSGTNTGTVAWGLKAACVGDGANINNGLDADHGVVATAKAHEGTSGHLNLTAESGAMTVNGAGEDRMTFFQVLRDVSADSQTGAARLLGIKLFFTTNAANDA